MANLSHAIVSLATVLDEATPAHPLRLRFGTISSVTTGGAADGTNAAFVTVGGDTIPAPYNAGYTPVAGDFVAVLLCDGSPLILCKVTGPPAL